MQKSTQNKRSRTMYMPPELGGTICTKPDPAPHLSRLRNESASEWDPSCTKQLNAIIDAAYPNWRGYSIQKNNIYEIMNGMRNSHGEMIGYVSLSEDELEDYRSQFKEQISTLHGIKHNFWYEWIAIEHNVEKDHRQLSKVYLNTLQGHESIFVCKAIAKRLIDAGVPFYLKTEADYKNPRVDRTVVHVPEKRASEAAEIITEFAKRMPELFREGSMLFAKPLTKGVSAAQSPTSDGGFGGDIAEAIAAGMEEAKADGTTNNKEVIALIRKNFEKRGIDPERPYLRLRLKDRSVTEQMFGRHQACQVAADVLAIEGRKEFAKAMADMYLKANDSMFMFNKGDWHNFTHDVLGNIIRRGRTDREFRWHIYDGVIRRMQDDSMEKRVMAAFTGRIFMLKLPPDERLFGALLSTAWNDKNWLVKSFAAAAALSTKEGAISFIALPILTVTAIVTFIQTILPIIR